MGRTIGYFTTICLNVPLYYKICEVTEPDVVVLHVEAIYWEHFCNNTEIVPGYSLSNKPYCLMASVACHLLVID